VGGKVVNCRSGIKIGNDWTPFTHGVSGGYFTSDGTISYLTMKSYARPVS